MRLTVYLDEGERAPGRAELAAQVRSGRVQMTVVSRPCQVLSSDGRTWYTVGQLPDGRWAHLVAEECRGFDYRGQCRHVEIGQAFASARALPDGAVVRVVP